MECSQAAVSRKRKDHPTTDPNDNLKRREVDENLFDLLPIETFFHLFSYFFLIRFPCNIP